MPAKREGFTLTELLVVMALAAILMAMLAGSLFQARELARRTRAETQLRDMVAAWTQYYQLYEKWPSDVAGQANLPVRGSHLDALTDPKNTSENPKGLVLLPTPRQRGENLEDAELYLDPWGNAYEMTYRKTGTIEVKTALATSVCFPQRRRQAPK